MILVLLLVLLARTRRQPSAADTGLLLPALRMGTAVLLVVFVGMVIVEMLPP